MQWNPQQVKQKTWFERFSEQPHQLFFTSALFFAVFFMVGTFLSLVGVNIDFHKIHIFGLIYGVFVNAILGFLLTVIPRYTKSIMVKKQDYMTVWILFLAGIFLMLIGFENISKAFIGSTLVYCSIVFVETILQGMDKKQIESWYLSILVGIGGLITLASIFIKFDFTSIVLWWFLFPLVFVVAQRMLPAFYGVYFNTEVKAKYFLFLPLSILGFYTIGLSIYFKLSIITALVSFAMSVLILNFIIQNHLYRKAPAILSILFIGISWLGIGFFSLAIESILLEYSFSLSLHIFTLGFLSTLLIGFGYRVVLGHSGNKIDADKTAMVIFSIIQFVLISRVVASILFINDSKAWIGFIHIGLMFWIVLFVLWIIKQGKLLIRF